MVRVYLGFVALSQYCLIRLMIFCLLLHLGLRSIDFPEQFRLITGVMVRLVMQVAKAILVTEARLVADVRLVTVDNFVVVIKLVQKPDKGLVVGHFI